MVAPSRPDLCQLCHALPIGGAALREEGYTFDVAYAACHDCAPALAKQFAELPAEVAKRQTREAVNRLHHGPDSLVRWPYPALDELHGPLAPGNLYFVAAISGGGKTTFLANTIREWDDAGIPLMVMPLEIRADEWRVWYACVRLGIDPGDALSGKLRVRAAAGDMAAQYARSCIAEELAKMQGRAESLTVRTEPHVTLDVFRKALSDAAKQDARIVIVDHVDHLAPSGGAGSNPLNDSRRVLHEALTLAQEYDLVLLLASQLNLDLARSPDRLAKYAPPQVQHLQFPGVKQQVATGIIGLYRPVNEDDPELLRRARNGLVEPALALKPNRMGVTMMKLRHYGKNEGRRVELRLEHGRLSDPHVPPSASRAA